MRNRWSPRPLPLAATLLAGVALPLALLGQAVPALQAPTQQESPPQPGPTKQGPVQPAASGAALRSAQPPGPRLRLQDLEQVALRRNPALAQATAAVRTAQALRRQAGAYPNPTVGFSGDELTPGPIIRGGEQGGFVEQRFVLGGKLGIQRQLADQDVLLAQADADVERYRVLTGVRMLYYQALGEQRLLTVRTELTRLARRAVSTTSELANVGQADRPDLLAVEIEADRLELGLITARNALDRTFRQLGAAVGQPDLQPALLEGNLEAVPQLDFDQSLTRLLEQSPELRMAQAGTARSELSVREAQRAVRPDLVARGGLHYNRERLELNQQPVGWQGSLEVGVSLPIFNRNRGAIDAARAEAERAGLAVDRTRLSLRSRLASSFRDYQDAMASVERYRTRMIPRAQRSYELYLSSFRQMAAAYPQVIISQRNLFQLQEDYIAALVMAWTQAVEIDGLLLGPDESPSHAHPAARMRTGMGVDPD